MSKFFHVALVLAVVLSAGTVFGGEAKSPVQSPVQAPKAPPPPTAARADSGYRTYSYEPGATNRSYSRGGLRTPGYLDARTKALGRY